jgi:hypothetical protein
MFILISTFYGLLKESHQTSHKKVIRVGYVLLIEGLSSVVGILLIRKVRLLKPVLEVRGEEWGRHIDYLSYRNY